MSAVEKLVLVGGMMVALNLLVVLPTSGEQPQSGVGIQEKGIRISKGKAMRVSGILNDIAAKSTNQTQAEIVDTKHKLNSPNPITHINNVDLRKMRQWLREDQCKRPVSSEVVSYCQITLGDTNEIAHMMGVLRAGGVNVFDIPENFAQTEQPLVIAAFAKDLFLEEKTSPIRIAEDVRIAPMSVNACYVIRSIIAGSPEFSDKVESWASGLSQLKIDKMREVLRRWWMKNESVFVSGEYDQVVPLTDAEMSVLPGDYIPLSRPIRKIKSGL